MSYPLEFAPSEDSFPQKKAGGSGWGRKTARSMKCPAITGWKNTSDAYPKAAGIEGDRKGPLFRAASGKTKKLGRGARSRTDV